MLKKKVEKIFSLKKVSVKNTNNNPTDKDPGHMALSCLPVPQLDVWELAGCVVYTGGSA